MPETNGLKPGDRYEYKVGDKTLIIEPIPYGRLSKLTKLILGSVDKISKMDSKDVMYKLPEIFDDKLTELISLIFDKKKHQFLNEQWVSDNLTLIDMKNIVEKGIKVNGLDDFLVKMRIGEKDPAVVTITKPTTSSPNTVST